MNNSWNCVDANLVIRYIVNQDDVVVRRLWETWGDTQQDLAAPTLLFYEVSNALYRYARVGAMSLETVHRGLDAALNLPIRLFGQPAIHTRALDLAARFSLPAAYDAHYLALADLLDGTLWTADRRLANAVQADLAWVQYVSPES